MTINPRLAALVLGTLCPSVLAQIQPVTEPVHGANDARTSHFWWSDFDGNGVSDAFVVHQGGDAVLLMNHGDGSFEDVTVRTGLTGLTGVRQALWQDVDGDTQPELYLVIPGGESKLFQYENGLFSEITQTAGLALESAVLQGEWLDTNSDGHADLHLSTTRGELLFQSLGNARFQEIDLEIATASAPWSPDLASWSRLADQDPALPLDAPATGDSGGTHAGTGQPGITSAGANDMAPPSLACLDSIKDQATLNCLTASTIPMVGTLYPLGIEFNIDGMGRVGIGTLDPGTALDVVGSIQASGQLISTAATGAPLMVTSTDQVQNLNADLLDGLDASAFSQLGQTIEGFEIAGLTVTGANLAFETVTGGQVKDESLTGADVFDGSLTGADFAIGTVTGGQVADGSLTGADVFDGSLTADDLATGSVGTLEVITDSLTHFDLASNSVNAAEISAGAVGTSEVADNSLTANDLAPNSVGSSEIAASAVGVSEIATGAVGSLEVLDNSLSSNDLGIGSVSTSEIANSSIFNVDVSPIAAIAGTKISPDFGAQSVSTTGEGSFTDGGPGPCAVEGIGTLGPTLGHLGAQGLTDFSGVLSADWIGFEMGVVGISTGGSVTDNFGVMGHSNNAGVRGEHSDDPGDDWGELGTVNIGVLANGDTAGVQATNSFSTLSLGQLATSSFGVHGEGSSAGGEFGNTADSTLLDGARGETSNSSGYALWGRNSSTTGSIARGVYGQTSSASSFGVYASGGFGGTGAKYFINPHPTDATKEIRFISLEGNESGTYFRGTSRIVDGQAIIDVPEVFSMVTNPDNLSIQLTAVGGPAMLWVESQDLEQVVVSGTLDVEFHYFVNGVRRGYEDHQLVYENGSYLPENLDEEYGTQYPDSYRQILVENGILNPDFMPNAARMMQLETELEHYRTRMDSVRREAVDAERVRLNEEAKARVSIDD